jgi:hypothetical protein
VSLKGAGGSPGGVGTFVLGFLMLCAGLYLLLQSIVVTHMFTLGVGLFRFALFGSPMNITGGMILIPFIIGVGLIFFNGRNWLGWGLAVGSLVALVVGVIASVQFVFHTMTLFDLLCILVLTVGGAGLLLRSLRPTGSETKA